MNRLNGKTAVITGGLKGTGIRVNVLSPRATATELAKEALGAEGQKAFAALAEKPGFSPIKLGELLEGGLLVHARGNSWGQLIFKDLAKFD